MKKKLWKRILSSILIGAMLITMMPITTLAALIDNTPDQNKEILSELEEFWGDDKTAKQAMELLKKYGLVDDDGNIVTNWSGSITIQEKSRALTFTEARTIGEATLTVNGRACEAAAIKAAIDKLSAQGLFAEDAPVTDWQLMVDGEAIAPAALADAIATEGEHEVTLRGEPADAAALTEVIEFLSQHDLLTETGAAENWNLTIPGGERETNISELLAMIENENYDPEAVITVDGTPITMADFATMMKIEEEIKRVQNTYLQDEVKLNKEQLGSLYSLYQQLSENGIRLYNTRGAEELVFPSGVNQNASVSVSLNKATVSGMSGGIVTATYKVTGAQENQAVSFDVHVLPGSAAGLVSEKTEKITISGNNSAQVTVSVNKLPSQWDNSTWNGQHNFYLYASNVKNATFADRAVSDIQTVGVTNKQEFLKNIKKSVTAAGTTAASNTLTFTEDQKYFINNQASDYDWSVSIKENPGSTAFSASSEADANTRSGYRYKSCYQYINGSLKINGTYSGGVEIGFSGSKDDLTKAINENKEAFYNAAHMGSSSLSSLRSSHFIAFPPVNDSWDSVIGSHNGTVKLPEGVSANSSFQLTAEGRAQKFSISIPKYTTPAVPVAGAVAQSSLNATTEITLKDVKAPTVTDVSFPEDTFYKGAMVPITVTFSEPVTAGSASLVVETEKVVDNELKTDTLTLSAAETTGTISKMLTFLFPVNGIEQKRITVDSILGAKDIAGNEMSIYQTTPSLRSEMILDTTTLLDAVSSEMDVPDDAVKLHYTPAEGGKPEKTTATVNVVVPLPKFTSLRNLIVDNYTLDDGLACASLAASIDGGKTLLPLVFDDGTAPTKMTATAEIDIAELVGFEGEAKPFVMEFYTIEGDAHEKKDLFYGRYAAFSVNQPVPLSGNALSITPPEGWPATPVYVNDPPEDAALTLTGNVSEGDYTWSQTRWVVESYLADGETRTEKAIAYVDANGVVRPQAPGMVKIYLEAVNGNLDQYAEQRSKPVTLTIQEGAAPYLRIPEESISVRSGDSATLRWASNLVQKNMKYGEDAAAKATTFNFQIYKGTDTSGDAWRTESVTYDPADQTNKELWQEDSPNQSYLLKGLNEISTDGDPSYTVVLSAAANEKVPSAKRTPYTAKVKVFVVSQPVSVKLSRPDNLFQVNQGSMTVNYALNHFDADNNAAFELTVTDNANGNVVYHSDTTEPDGGSFTLDLGVNISDNFRTIYDVSVKAKNTAEKDWSRDSFTLYIYDKNALDILVQPVKQNDVTTVGVDGNTVTMSNEDWIRSLTQDQILALNRDIDLQTVISINYGDHAWGEASDRIKWASANSDTAAVNYLQGSYYENIESLPYVSYAPATEFLLSGKNDGKTAVEAVHALAGDALGSSVEVNVETLKDKLYLFQFYPAGQAYVTYTNGDGKLVENHPTDSSGRAAIYEASGIASDVYIRAEIDSTVYLGTIYRQDLVSQEKDAVSLELYPLNSLNLRKVADLPVFLKKPDGSNFTGDVTARVGVYRNGEYCSEAKYTNTAGTQARTDGTTDNTVHFDKETGAATFYFDPTQFNTNHGTDNVTAADDIQFVLELRAEGYYPVLCTASGTTNSDDQVRMAEHTISLQNVPKGQENQPFVAQQIAYFAGKESGLAADVRGKSGKVGSSNDYRDILLSTVVFWWGETKLSSESLRFVDKSNIVLSGQTVKQNVYPFCSIPVVKNSLHLNEEQYSNLSLKNRQNRIVSLQYSQGDEMVKQEQMRWQVINMLESESAVKADNMEYQVEMLKKLMLNSSSDGVSLKNDFLAAGIQLATASGVDLPVLRLQMAPTGDPSIFRGMVYIGLNNFEGDNVSGVAADTGRSEDLDYYPNLDAVKGLYKQGPVGYVKSALGQAKYAGQILGNYMRQGSGHNKTGDNKISYALQGYFETEIYYDFNVNEWKMVVVNGGFTAGGGFGYEWTWNLQAGPVPLFVQLEAGAAGAVEFKAAVDRTQNANDYLTEVRLYAYLQAFGGLGFDYSVIALKVGLFGRVGLDATLRWFNAIGASSADFGAYLDVKGEIGMKFQVELLFISYEKILWSEPIGHYSGPFQEWETIEKEWEKVKKGNSGNTPVIEPTETVTQANLMGTYGDNGIYAIDQEATLLDRSYLEDYQRSYNSADPSLDEGFSLFRLLSPQESSPVVETLGNAYPLTEPVLSNDGGYLFYLDDNGDASDATNVRAAVMKRSGTGYNSGEGINLDSYKSYGDSNLKAAGTGDQAVAVWSRVTEKPAITEPGQAVTADVQAGMLNSSDIMVAVRNGSDWKVRNLTISNNSADLSPVVATNGNRILVAWRQVASSNATDLTNFDMRDYIYYRVSDDNGDTWTDAEPIYNGTSGAVKGIEAAMLDNGEAAVAFTIQTDELDAASGEYAQEIAYAIVDKEESGYDVARYVQMTDDKNLDENPQIASVKLNSDGEEVFVLGWHCLNAESGDSDIRLAAVDKNGLRITGFVDALSSLIQNSEACISSNFQFSHNADTLDELSILWSDTAAAEGESTRAAHDTLNALRFRTTGDKISVTAAQQIAEMNDYTTINNFNAYVGDNQKLFAAIQGTYYDYENATDTTVEYSDGTTGTVSVAGEKTSIYTAVGAYTDTMRVDSVLPDYANIRKGTAMPVQISLTNLGTQPLTAVEVKIDNQTTKFKVGEDGAFTAIAPGEARSLTVFYQVPSAGTIPDPGYTVTGIFEDSGSKDTYEDKMVLNIPDLGIANSNVLVDAADGQRILQFSLYNLSEAELADSNRSIGFNLYSDAECTSPIDPKYLTLVNGTAGSKEELLTLDSNTDLAAVDEGSYALQCKFDLKQYIDTEGFADADHEVRDGGVTLYAKAWVELPGDDGGELLEYVTSNNVTAINLESLLKQANGEHVTITSKLARGETGTDVNVTLMNNSIVNSESGNIIVTLLDEKGKVLDYQQSYNSKTDDTGSSLVQLNPEEEKGVSFNFSQTGAAVQVSYSDLIMDDNTNADLAELTFSGIPVTLADFKLNTTNNRYECTVTTKKLASTLVTASAKSPSSRLSLTGDTSKGINILSETVALKQKATKTITLTATSGNGEVTKTYALTIKSKRPAAGDGEDGSGENGSDENGGNSVNTGNNVNSGNNSGDSNTDNTVNIENTDSTEKATGRGNYSKTTSADEVDSISPKDESEASGQQQQEPPAQDETENGASIEQGVPANNSRLPFVAVGIVILLAAGLAVILIKRRKKE